MNAWVGKGNITRSGSEGTDREPGAARAASTSGMNVRERQTTRERKKERKTRGPTMNLMFLFNSSAALFHKWVWNSDNHSIVGSGCLSVCVFS